MFKNNICNMVIGFSIFASLLLILNRDDFTFYTNKPSVIDNADFKIETVFVNQRFPNLGVALDGTVIATWGKDSVLARLSKDGGATWGSQITIAETGIHGGGLIVDDFSGEIIIFVQERHPPAPTYIYRSKDSGETWKKESTTIQKRSE